jgi:Zn-dependent oligopeptidase
MTIDAVDPKLKAPRTPLQWDHTPEAIALITTITIKTSQSIKDHIAALPVSERNFSTVFLQLALEATVRTNTAEQLAFYQNVSPDEALRNAAETAEKRFNKHRIESSMRLDTFQALRDAKVNIDRSGQMLSFEEERLVEKMLLEGKRDGLDLPEETRADLVKVYAAYMSFRAFIHDPLFNSIVYNLDLPLAQAGTG